MHRHPVTLMLLVPALLLAGCFGARRESPLSSSPWRDEPAPAAVPSVPEGAGPTSPRAHAGTDYKLAPRDQVIFQMFNEETIETTQRLSSTGEMTLPLVGTVPLAGKTLREAEQFIRQRYVDSGYFVDPQVILSVAEYDVHYVQVLGQVNSPSRIELPIEANAIGLVEAITQAGGFTRVARTDSVQVRRRNAEGRDEHYTVDVREFLSRRGGNRGEEFQLLPGDVVFVRERLI